jgi:AcrR family transcriptional regulator
LYMRSVNQAPRRMRAPARREQLLDIATELAIEEGFHGVSIEAIARRAGVTRAVIYQHFADLQALLESMITRETTRAMAQVSESALPPLESGDTAELMLASLATYLRVVHDHPMTWRLILLSSESAPAKLRVAIAQGRGAVLAQLASSVSSKVRAGNPNDAELTATILSAVADAYALLVLSDTRPYRPEELVDHARRWLEQPTFGL